MRAARSRINWRAGPVAGINTGPVVCDVELDEELEELEELEAVLWLCDNRGALFATAAIATSATTSSSVPVEEEEERWRFAMCYAAEGDRWSSAGRVDLLLSNDNKEDDDKKRLQ